MIFLTAINDISIGSKFNLTIENVPVGYNDRMWGITELSSSTFKKINSGDWAMFYNKGSIIGAAKIEKKIIDKHLSIKLWGSYTHKFNGQLTWENILVFSNYFSTNIPFSEIVTIGGYKENFSVRRLINLNDLATKTILHNYKTEENYINDLLKRYNK